MEYPPISRMQPGQPQPHQPPQPHQQHRPPVSQLPHPIPPQHRQVAYESDGVPLLQSTSQHRPMSYEGDAPPLRSTSRGGGGGGAGNAAQQLQAMQVLVLDNNDLRNENQQLRSLLARYQGRFGEI